MLDFRIELSQFADRVLPWEWVTYAPRDVESALHCGGKNYETPAAALAPRWSIWWQPARGESGTSGFWCFSVSVLDSSLALALFSSGTLG
jgi:hypothetical protein